MKKICVTILLCTSLTLYCLWTKERSSSQKNCSSYAQTIIKHSVLFPSNHYRHGAPTQAVATLCSEFPDDYCGYNTRLIAIGGFASECIDYPQSIRLYQLTDSNTLREISLADPSENLPSPYIYTTAICCYNNAPFIVFAGAPNNEHEVLWVYRYDAISDTYSKVCSWAFATPESARCIYGVAINCQPCIDGLTGEPFLQIAAVGKPDLSGNNSILLFKFQADPQSCSLDLINEISVDGTQYKAAWCTYKDCSLLVVGGQSSMTDQCSYANLNVYSVNCNFAVVPAVAPVLVGNKDVKIRALAACCDKKPYPFFAVAGTYTVDDEPLSVIKVYFYDPRGHLRELAVLDGDGTIAGHYFAIAFDPACDCQSITVAGGTCKPDALCKKNIITYAFKCPKKGRYPALMKKIESASGFFAGTITDLAFCKNTESDYYDMIVTSEAAECLALEKDPLCAPCLNKNEIGLFKAKFCQQRTFCNPVPICSRKNKPFDPCLD